jgi:hypothetical protein
MTSTGARERARRLLLHEAAGARGPRDVAAAAERVCGKLRGELTGLIGAGGVGALASRALRLAQRDFPQLDGVAGPNGHDGCYAGLVAALEGRSATEAEAAGVAVIEHFLGLLVSLVGEDLAMTPLLRLWPGIVGGDAAPGPTERDL